LIDTTLNAAPVVRMAHAVFVKWLRSRWCCAHWMFIGVLHR